MNKRTILKADVMLIAAICCLGCFVRVYHLDAQSLWYDEAVSFLPLKHAVNGEITEYAKWRAQPETPRLGTGVRAFLREERLADPPMVPLYFLLQYGWATLFGVEMYALRMLSVVFGVAGIALMFLTGVECGGRIAGLTAALCLALAQPHIYYSQEIRMYALMILLCCCAIYSLLRAVRTGAFLWWAGNVLSNMLLVWTHLFAVFFIVAQMVFMALFARKTRNERLFKYWVSVQAANGALLALWLATLDLVRLDAASDWKSRITHGFRPLKETFLVFTGYPTFYTSGAGAPTVLGVPTGLVFGLVFLCMLAAVLSAAVKRRTPIDLSGPQGQATPPFDTFALLLLFLLLLVPPILLQAMSAFIHPCYLPRYVLHASLPLYVLVGLFAARFPRKWLRAAVPAVLLVLYAHQLYYAPPQTWRRDWSSAAAYVEARISGQERLLVLPGYHVLGIFANRPTFPAPRVVFHPTESWQFLRQELELGRFDPSIAWILMTTELPESPNQIASKFREKGLIAETKTFGAGQTRLHLFHVKPARLAVTGERPLSAAEDLSANNSRPGG